MQNAPCDPLTKLYIEPTTACNLDCVMCVQRAWNEPIGAMALADYALLMDQVRAFDRPPRIHLSGYGEPTAHPHFLDLVALAKATGAAVELTTNGTRLDDATVDALLELDLDRLVVSLDGVSAAHYESIRERASFERVVGSLRRLRRRRIQMRGRHGNPQLVLAFVAMRDNVADLGKLPWLAAHLGAWNVVVSNVVPHSPLLEEQILYKQALRSCTFRASRWVPDVSLPKLDLQGGALDAVQETFASRASVSLLGASLSRRNDYCQFAHEGYAAVRWDGAVSPCLSLLHNHPEYIHGRRKDVTHHAFGNVRETPLRVLWEGDAFRRFRADLRAFHFSPCTTCGGCERFPANYEDCTGNGFPTCGGCLWAQGFVQCP